MIDYHVQAWTRERVRVLAMLEELRLLTERCDKIELTRRLKRSRATVDAVRTGVREDGRVTYVTPDGDNAGVELASVPRHETHYFE